MADARRLAELSMPVELAKETATQIDGAVASKTQVAALTPIADPSTATAEDVANAVNAVIAALQA